MSETWIINESPDVSSSNYLNVSINFTSNSTSFDTFIIQENAGAIGLDGIIYKSGYVCTTIFFNYSDGYWVNTAYRTVTFETSPTGDLLTWLTNNAVKQETESKPTLKINNFVIDTFNSKGISSFAGTEVGIVRYKKSNSRR